MLQQKFTVQVTTLPDLTVLIQNSLEVFFVPYLLWIRISISNPSPFALLMFDVGLFML
jgi:hypothetical protein